MEKATINLQKTRLSVKSHLVSIKNLNSLHHTVRQANNYNIKLYFAARYVKNTSHNQ